MNKIQAYWNERIAEGHNYASYLHGITGFTYRVRRLFNGVNVEAYSPIKQGWFLVKVIR